MKIQDRGFENEIKFSATRSSGPGGQSVNKVNSKIELRFNIMASRILSIEEKDKILKRLQGYINSENELLLFSQEHRSQHQNKETALKKFYLLIENALIDPKPRRKTKTPARIKKRRLEEKKMRSRMKKDRGWNM